MPTAAPQFDIEIAHLSPGWRGNFNDLIDAIVARMTIEVPAGFLTGWIGSDVPPPNSGPWLKDGTTWYVWDIVSGQYIAMESAEGIGRVEEFAYSAVDVGRYVICDGSAIPRAAPYDVLYSRVGQTFGGGNGSTTFNVPDLRGRTVIGVGAGTIPGVGGAPATSLTNRILGERLGEETHKMAVNEMRAIDTSAASKVVANGTDKGYSTAEPIGHNIMQPSIALVKAIRYA